MKRAAVLHIGDYAARWNTNGTLEIQYTNSKGKPDHERFQIRSGSKEERPLQNFAAIRSMTERG